MPSLSCLPIQSALCSMLGGFLDQGLDFLDKAQRLLNPRIDGIQLDLSQAVSIDLSKLTDMLNGIGNFDLPDFSTDCLSMLATTIENCPYLADNSLLSDLAGLVNTLDKWLKFDLEESLRNLFPDFSGIPLEIGIALDLNFAFNLCLDLKLDSLIPDMSKIFNCVKSFCPSSDMSSRLARLDNSLSNMNLSAGGTLDVNAVLSASGISPAEANAFSACNSALTAKKAAISTAVLAGAEIARTTVIPTTGDKYFTVDAECDCNISSLLSVQIVDCTANILIETSTKACLSPCAICEVDMIGVLGVEMVLTPSMLYVNSYVGNSVLTVVEAGPIALTTDTEITTNSIGVLTVT